MNIHQFALTDCPSRHHFKKCHFDCGPSMARRPRLICCQCWILRIPNNCQGQNRTVLAINSRLPLCFGRVAGLLEDIELPKKPGLPCLFGSRPMAPTIDSELHQKENCSACISLTDVSLSVVQKAGAGDGWFVISRRIMNVSDTCLLLLCRF